MLISYKAIGRNIRTARQHIGFTQEQAAERMKISLLHFGRLERGERPISLELLANIAKTLDTSLAALLNGCMLGESFETAPSADSASPARTIEALAAGCSPQAQQLMVALCREVARSDKSSTD